MSFKKFLLESEGVPDFNQIVEMLKKDCGPFIDLLSYQLLLRGSGMGNDAMVKKEVRKNRKSVDTPQYINNLFDGIAEQKIGFSPRLNGVFTTFDAFQAEDYGRVNVVFPVGDIKFFYLDDIGDFYSIFILPNSSSLNEDNPKLKFIVDAYKEFANQQGQAGGLSHARHVVKDASPELKREFFSELFPKVIDKLGRTTNINDAADGEIIVMAGEYYSMDYVKFKSMLRDNGHNERSFIDLLKK